MFAALMAQLAALCSQFLFQQLGMLVSFVKSHIRPYMDEIVTLMRVSTCRCSSLLLLEGTEGSIETGLGNADMLPQIILELLQHRDRR